MWSNCLLFAWGKLIRCGGYGVVRPSRHGWWPHFGHTFDFETVEVFVCSSARVDRWFHKARRVIPPLLFPGVVVQMTRQQFLEGWRP